VWDTLKSLGFFVPYERHVPDGVWDSDDGHVPDGVRWTAPPLVAMNMAHVSNLSPSDRPPTPSLDRGPIQVRTWRAFIGSGLEVMSTPQIAEWTHPRGTSRRHAYRHVRDVCERYCVRAGRASTVGRPILWRLRDMDSSMGRDENGGN
jgi:hypothetical protein